MLARVAPLLLVSACFGEGPLPSPPSAADVVFYVSPPAPDQRCSGSARYIGDVAFGTDNGFAVTLPYIPNNCGNGPTMLPPSLTLDVYSFSKASGGSTSVGNAGMTQNNGSQRPRIASDGTNPYWVYWNPTNGLDIGPLNYPISSQMGTYNPAALVVDGGTLYIAGQQMTGGGTDPEQPQWPCCGSFNQSGTNDQVAKLPATGGMWTSFATGQGLSGFYNDEMKAPLVANSTTLFAMARGDLANGKVAQIMQIDKSTGNTTMLDLIPSNVSPGITPVGLAADSAHVVWSAASNATAYPFTKDCWIWSRELAGSSQAKLVFFSSTISCLDAALDGDGDHIYFAIVDIPPSDNNNQNQNQNMNGLGIGRVSISTGMFESIALGIEGEGVGPRRIYLDAGSIYAVAPTVIGRIAKSELDGKAEF